MNRFASIPSAFKKRIKQKKITIFNTIVEEPYALLFFMKIVVDYAHNHVEICRLDFTRKLLFNAFYFAKYTTVVVRVVAILCLHYLTVVRKKHLCQAHSIYLVQRSYSCYNRLYRLHVENIDFNFTGCATIHSLANTLHKLIVQSNNEANVNCVWCIKVRDVHQLQSY